MDKEIMEQKNSKITNILKIGIVLLGFIASVFVMWMFLGGWHLLSDFYTFEWVVFTAIIGLLFSIVGAIIFRRKSYPLFVLSVLSAGIALLDIVVVLLIVNSP